MSTALRDRARTLVVRVSAALAESESDLRRFERTGDSRAMIAAHGDLGQLRDAVRELTTIAEILHDSVEREIRVMATGQAA